MPPRRWAIGKWRGPAHRGTAIDGLFAASDAADGPRHGVRKAFWANGIGIGEGDWRFKGVGWEQTATSASVVICRHHPACRKATGRKLLSLSIPVWRPERKELSVGAGLIDDACNGRTGQQVSAIGPHMRETGVDGVCPVGVEKRGRRRAVGKAKGIA